MCNKNCCSTNSLWLPVLSLNSFLFFSFSCIFNYCTIMSYVATKSAKYLEIRHLIPNLLLINVSLAENGVLTSKYRIQIKDPSTGIISWKLKHKRKLAIFYVFNFNFSILIIALILSHWSEKWEIVWIFRSCTISYVEHFILCSLISILFLYFYKFILKQVYCAPKFFSAFFYKNWELDRTIQLIIWMFISVDWA